MANINDLSSTDTLTAGDLFPVWRTANSDTRKVSMSTLSNYVFSNLTTLPDGTISISVPVIDQTGAVYKTQRFLGGSLTTTVPAWTIERSFAGVAATRPWTLLLRNQGEVSGGVDYQNEVHLVLQAGTSANHRRYLDWIRYDGGTDFILGVNGILDFVIQEHEAGVHRLTFQNETNGGHTLLNASGASGIIRMAYHPQDEVAPLAVKMYRGGVTADATLAFDFQPEYLALYNSAGDLNMILRADTGNIGVGKTTPNYKVDIETTGNQPFRWVADSDGAPSTFLAGNTGISYVTTQTSSTSQFALTDQDNAADRFILELFGNAGGIDAFKVASNGDTSLSTGSIKTTTAGVGFHSATPIAKPDVTGSRGGNAALANLLTALATYGLITDSTTA